MRLRATTLALTWAVCCFAGATLLGKPQGGDPPQKTPAQLFKAAKDYIRDGRFDVAAEELKKFLAANPTEKDYLDIMAKEPTAFQKLRNVPVWSDETKSQAEAVKTVEAIIAKSEEANKKVHRNPARIAKFTKNLGESLEERIYAEQQLKLAGDAAVPIMIDQLRTSSSVELRAGILAAISKLSIDTAPGFLAAVDGLPDDLKIGIIRALAVRSDVLDLLSAAETDFAPHLWNFAGAKGEDGRTLREFAGGLLEQLAGPGWSRRKPEAVLVETAEKFAKRTARFRNPDRIRLWTWDAAKLNVASVDATKAQAEEYYAIRTIRWALAINPADEAAKELFLTTTVERSIERGKFGDLAENDPVLYQVLAATPAETLIGLLDQALTQQRTALSLGLTQALAARADRTAAQGLGGKPGVLAKALDYPDPRVQLAAAIGMLKAPVAASHGKGTRIVDILRRAAATESGGKEMGRVLIADPSTMRADRLAMLVRQAGYAAERFTTGRDLTRRVNRAADYDIVLVDRHIVDPLLADVVAQLRGDANHGRRPVVVVASSDTPRALPLEYHLQRLAVLIAATETSAIEIPPPFAFDPARPVQDVDKARADLRQLRDKRLQALAEVRLGRLERLVEASDFTRTRQLADRLAIRLPQLTYAILAVEYQATAESAPELVKRLQSLTTLIFSQPELTAATENVPTDTLNKLTEQMDGALQPERRQRLEQLLAKLDPAALGLPADTARNLALEEQLAKQLRRFPGVGIISEPLTLVGFAEDLRAAAGDPAQLPRDPAEKKRSAKLAVEWLKRIATGEVAGYDIRPAEAALRQALRDDDLAPDAIDAVAKIGSGEAQQDLLFVALSTGRPVPLRTKAADRTIQHIQAFGKLTPPNQVSTLSQTAEAEMTNELKAKLLVIHQLVAGKPEALGGLMSKYPIPVPAAPPVAPPPGGAAEPKKQ